MKIFYNLIVYVKIILLRSLWGKKSDFLGVRINFWYGFIAQIYTNKSLTFNGIINVTLVVLLSFNDNIDVTSVCYDLLVILFRYVV
jgi:hypothetical protein